MSFLGGFGRGQDGGGVYVCDMLVDGGRQIRVQAYEDWFVDKRVQPHEAGAKVVFDQHKVGHKERAVKEAVKKDEVWVYVMK